MKHRLEVRRWSRDRVDKEIAGKVSIKLTPQLCAALYDVLLEWQRNHELLSSEEVALALLRVVEAKGRFRKT